MYPTLLIPLFHLLFVCCVPDCMNYHTPRLQHHYKADRFGKPPSGDISGLVVLRVFGRCLAGSSCVLRPGAGLGPWLGWWPGPGCGRFGLGCRGPPGLGRAGGAGFGWGPGLCWWASCVLGALPCGALPVCLRFPPKVSHLMTMLV